jgi:hypothetical protein
MNIFRLSWLWMLPPVPPVFFLWLYDTVAVWVDWSGRKVGGAPPDGDRFRDFRDLLFVVDATEVSLISLREPCR